MSIKDNSKVLVIKNGFNGDEFYIKDWFNYSSFTQTSMLEDIAIPMLYDYKKIYISLEDIN